MTTKKKSAPKADKKPEKVKKSAGQKQQPGGSAGGPGSDKLSQGIGDQKPCTYELDESGK